ncbi:WD40 repeat-like protein [Trametes punicea]|nr:WD40 repeat-like protein [Trametes punicea]
METAAHSIYAQQLLPKKCGYPLWYPEPGKFGEVQIGDVGYFHGGGFYRLFNAVAPREAQQEYGVPDDYVPFVVRPYLLNHRKDAIQGHLTSVSVNMMEVSGGAGTSMQAANAGVKFACTRERGAFLFVKPGADSSVMHKSKGISSYIRTNIESWYHFATDALDLDISRHEICFVIGTVKTEDWGLGAFLREGSGCEITFQTNLGPFAQGSFSLNRANALSSGVEYRTKPLADIASPTPSPVSLNAPAIAAASSGASPSMDASSSALSLQRTQSGSRKDQTVFLSYYKMKRQWWRTRVVRAAAGPDKLPHPPGSDDNDDFAVSSEGETPELIGGEETYDPVDFILDYILDYTFEDGRQPDAAIAGVDDLYALFDEDFPEDIPASLQELKPPIVFLDDELAALACVEWSEELDDIVEASDKVHEAPGAGPSRQGDDNEAQDGDDHVGSLKKRRRPLGKERALEGDDTADWYPRAIVLQDHTSGVSCVAWSPDGRYIASGSEDTTIVLRDGTTGEFLHRLTDHSDAVWSLAFSPDGQRLVSGAGDGFALIWDVAKHTVVAVLGGLQNVVQSVEYSPDGKRIVTSSVDSSVRIWDAYTGALLHTMEDHRALIMAAIFSPNGRWVASCSADYTAKIWDAETGALHRTLEGHDGIVWQIAFDPEGRRVVTGSDDASSRVWSAETGEVLVILYEHPSPVWGVAFSPDGKRVLSVSNDMTIKLCDSYTGKLIHTFNRDDVLASVAVFSPDGEYVASSGCDNQVLLWDTRTGKQLPPMDGHSDRITALQFSPDGIRLVSGSDDGTVRIWTIPGVEA